MIKDILDNNKNMEPNGEKILKLKELFPSCFNDKGDLDLVNFQNEISKNIQIIKEGYGLNFLGKNYAKYVADRKSVV